MITTTKFLDAGWSLIDARPLNTPWQRYRDYVAQSRGEFCVAKNGYVDPAAAGSATAAPPISRSAGPSFCRRRAGPISTRKAKACSPSTTRKAPAPALETVAKDPVRHARAARAIAEKYCAAPVVVNQFLETIGHGSG